MNAIFYRLEKHICLLKGGTVMVSGRSCTVMHLGRQGIDGGVRLHYLDTAKLRYSGIYQLML